MITRVKGISFTLITHLVDVLGLEGVLSFTRIRGKLCRHCPNFFRFPLSAT